MKKTVVVLGDSITYGHGCFDRSFYFDRKSNTWIGNADILQGPPSEHCWASLLAKYDSNIQVINLAFSGNNNSNIAWKLDEFLTKTKTKVDMVIANFSYDDRIEFAPAEGWDIRASTNNPYANITTEPLSVSPVHVNTILEKSNSKYILAAEMYRDHLYHPLWGVKLAHNALNAVVGLCLANGIKLAWSSVPLSSLDNSEFILSSMIQYKFPSIMQQYNILNIQDYSTSELTAPCGHPSNLAHQMFLDDIILPLMKSHKFVD